MRSHSLRNEIELQILKTLTEELMDLPFITGTDLLIDGGVIASIRTGQYKLH